MALRIGSLILLGLLLLGGAWGVGGKYRNDGGGGGSGGGAGRSVSSDAPEPEAPSGGAVFDCVFDCVFE